MNSLLIYVPKLSNRLGYTLNVIFRHVLQADFNITDNVDYYLSKDCYKLCYGAHRIGDTPWIKADTLLFSTTIETQDVAYVDYGGYEVPFAVHGHDLDFPFDVFAATFYLVSRYEEYLPHRNDLHGRYLSAESMAVQHGFILKPVVEDWALDIVKKIQERYSLFGIPSRHFELETTIDIDLAYCYLHKGIMRTILGFLRDGLHRHDWEAVRRRWKVVARKEQDPYDTFDYILQGFLAHPKSRLLFFALMGDYGMYDKPTSHHNHDFLQLLQHLDDFAKMGIHVSYASFDKPEKIEQELTRLANTIHRNVEHNRCHFLRLALPNTYRNLMHTDILHDYTMGYAEQPGFRASISTPYPFYDLSHDEEAPLIIHPFAVMDTTLKRYCGLNPNGAWNVIKELMDNVSKVQGTFSCIFHNENLCEMFGWEGWRQVYERVLDYDTTQTHVS
ncbi:MAG: polysaccharide deacetylase family protein [Bacteroidales bacterium]|nr:polysaccharide deacetylase family protein [Bacteroidales bacterium]